MKKLVLILLACAGCHSSLTFTCSTDDQCRVGSTQGICVQPSGVCALPAADCPTGYRYDPSAGELGGTCVAEVDGDMQNVVDTDMGTADMAAADMAILPGHPFPAQLLYPPSGSFAESKRPLFKWSLPANGGTPTVEVCNTRSCLSTIANVLIDSSGSSGRTDADLPTGVVYWRVKTTTPLGTAYSPTWEFESPGRESGKTTAWGALPDFNGDGKGEFVSTAWCAPNTGATTASQCLGGGKVYVYQLGHETTPVALAPTAQAGAFFGYTLAVTDVNGDGFVDLAVGAPFLTANSVMNGGAVYVFLGSQTGIQSANPIVLAGPDGGSFGFALSADDIDGDGYGDLVIAAPGVAVGGGNSGRLYIYFGGSTGFRTQPAVRDSPEGGTFPKSVAAVDLNGDGFADAVATTNLANISGTIKGRIYVYAGGPNGPSMTPSIIDAGSNVGSGSLGPAGDVDGDGYPDLLSANTSGTAAIYKGASGGAVGPPAWSFAQPADLTGNVGFANYGSGLRDVDGDGFDDVAISASQTTDGGRVCVYRGSLTGPNTTAVNMYLTRSSLPADAQYGARIAYNDVDGDGIGDIVTSAPCQGESAAGKCDGAGGIFALFDPLVSGGLMQSTGATGLDGAYSRYGDQLH